MSSVRSTRSARRPYDHDRWETVGNYVGLVTIAAILGSLAMCGCGASQLQRHAKGLQGARTALDVAAVGIETACEPEDVAARDDAPDRARACLRAAESHDAARAAWQTYAAALVLAADGDDLDLFAVLPLARALLSAYAETAETLQSFGVDAPGLPAFLESLR